MTRIFDAFCLIMFGIGVLTVALSLMWVCFEVAFLHPSVLPPPPDAAFAGLFFITGTLLLWVAGHILNGDIKRWFA